MASHLFCLGWGWVGAGVWLLALVLKAGLSQVAVSGAVLAAVRKLLITLASLLQSVDSGAWASVVVALRLHKWSSISCSTQV